jgi:hypothetical protein
MAFARSKKVCKFRAVALIAVLLRTNPVLAGGVSNNRCRNFDGIFQMPSNRKSRPVLPASENASATGL